MSKRPIPALVLALLIAGYIAFFTAQLFLHYYSFGSRALDLGNFDQAIWNTLHGRPFHLTNMPGVTSRLSLHVEPILLPISLLYLIYSGPETLFVLQSAVVALGAVPVFALARLKLGSDGLALIFAAAFLMYPPLQGATLLDFHAVTLAPAFLLAAFYYLETDSPRRFALFAVLAASCKEDIPLLVLMMGVYAFFINRQRRLGAATVALSAGWVFLAVFVIPQTFAASENIHWGRYSHLGDNALDIVLNFFTQPHLFLAHLQRVDTLNYFRLLLTPTAFTALLNPITLLLAAPSFGINLLSNFPPMQEVNTLIYVAPAVHAVFISSIYGVANIMKIWKGMLSQNGRLAGWKARKIAQSSSLSGSNFRGVRHPQMPNIAASEDAASSNLDLLSLPIFQGIRHPQLLPKYLLGAVIIIATVIYHANYGYLPGGGQFRGWEEVTGHHRRAERILAQIPSDASLSAHDRLNPHVSQRQTLYIFDRVDDAEYIVLDITEDSWPLHPLELRHRVDQFLDGDFGVVDAFDGYLLLAKNRPDLPATLPDAFFDFARLPNPDAFTPQFPATVTFDNKLQLLGYSLSLGGHENFLPVATLYWRALEPLDDAYLLRPFFIDRDGQLITDPGQYPLVAPIWYPLSRWSPDEIIATRTLPQNLTPNPGDRFTLAVGVAKGAWDDPAQRLPITQADDWLYTLEKNTWVRLGAFQRVERKTYRPLSATVDPPQQPRQVQFANIINLQGVDLPATPIKPGDTLPFTLHWQGVAPITVDLTTFAHLLDSEGNTVAQQDWTPQDSLGYLPTTAWQPERPVVDSRAISLPADTPPGQYRLVVGWYYAPTGQRLPLTVTDIPGIDENSNVAQIGVVSVQK